MSRAGRYPPRASRHELYRIIEHTVRPLVHLVEQADIEELRVHHGALQVVIRRDCMAGTPTPSAEHPSPAASAAQQGAPAAPPATPPVHYVRAGVVGFFHLVRPQGRGATTPAVAVGQRVRTGQVVGYIEAMSVVSEVESDADGEVLSILASEGQPVEYGQPLIELRLEVREPGTTG